MASPAAPAPPTAVFAPSENETVQVEVSFIIAPKAWWDKWVELISSSLCFGLFCWEKKWRKWQITLRIRLGNGRF